jgi:hypothetical protein
MDHTIGYLTSGLILIAVVGMFAFTRWRWGRRWDVDRFGSVPVRFARGARHTERVGADLERLGRLVRHLRREYPDNPELTDFGVEVVPPGGVRTATVPNGTFPDGSQVGVSVRKERWLPFSSWFWVAVVVDESMEGGRIRSADFVAHEVCSHIIPARLGSSVQTHDRDGNYYPGCEKWLELERAAKVAMRSEA